MPAGVRTLEEIEAELMASSRAQQQQQQQPMTLEEIEKEMMKNLRLDPSTAQQQAPPGLSQPGQTMPQQAGYQGQFPALGGMPSGFPGATQGMYGRPMEQGQPIQQIPQPPFMDPRIAGLSAPGQQAQGGNPDVARLLGIVPLETGVSEEERMNAELEMKIKETEVAEMKRRRKADKIAGMSRYNGIMTQGMSGFVAIREVCADFCFSVQVTRNSSPEFNSPSW
jgi:hypothetical protein